MVGRLAQSSPLARHVKIDALVELALSRFKTTDPHSFQHISACGLSL